MGTGLFGRRTAGSEFATRAWLLPALMGALWTAAGLTGDDDGRPSVATGVAFLAVGVGLRLLVRAETQRTLLAAGLAWALLGGLALLLDDGARALPSVLLLWTMVAFGVLALVVVLLGRAWHPPGDGSGSAT